MSRDGVRFVRKELSMRSKATTWRCIGFAAADKPRAAIAFLRRKLDDHGTADTVD
jgi:hypothetical protein